MAKLPNTAGVGGAGGGAAGGAQSVQSVPRRHSQVCLKSLPSSHLPLVAVKHVSAHGCFGGEGDEGGKFGLIIIPATLSICQSSCLFD